MDLLPYESKHQNFTITGGNDRKLRFQAAFWVTKSQFKYSWVYEADKLFCYVIKSVSDHSFMYACNKHLLSHHDPGKIIHFYLNQLFQTICEHSIYQRKCNILFFILVKKKKKCYDVIFTVITFPVIAWIFFMEWKTSILRRMKVLDSSLQALGGMNAVCLFPIVYSFFSFSFSFCSVLTGASVLLPNLRPSSFSTWHEIAAVMLSDKSMNQCLNLSCWTLRNPTWILWFILQHMPNKNEMPVMMLH